MEGVAVARCGDRVWIRLLRPATQRRCVEREEVAGCRAPRVADVRHGQHAAISLISAIIFLLLFYHVLTVVIVAHGPCDHPISLILASMDPASECGESKHVPVSLRGLLAGACDAED